MMNRPNAGVTISVGLLLVFAPYLSRSCAGTGKLNQENYRSCGVSCLFMATQFTGMNVSLDEIHRLIRPAPDGSARFSDLERAATNVGLFPTTVQVPYERLGSLPFPMIAHMKSRPNSPNGNHYILVLAVFRDSVVYLDPPLVPIHASADFFRELWTGNVICFAASDIEARRLETAVADEFQRRWLLGSLPIIGLATVLFGLALKRLARRR